jgi:hypothetical protein
MHCGGRRLERRAYREAPRGAAHKSTRAAINNSVQTQAVNVNARFAPVGSEPSSSATARRAPCGYRGR